MNKEYFIERLKEAAEEGWEKALTTYEDDIAEKFLKDTPNKFEIPKDCIGRVILLKKNHNNKAEKDFLDNDEYTLFIRETDNEFEYIRFNKKIKEIFKGE